jgi:hypothetical protein
MSEVLWWREETWWERRSLPLLGFNLAPRQLFMLGLSGLAGFALSATFLRDSLFGRIGVLLFFLSIGFVFATKRVKMAPVELQLYYRFVRRQGILRSAREVQRVVAKVPAPPVRPGIDHRPLLFGTVAGCLLATVSLSALASGANLKATGEGLLAFVSIAGALSFGMDMKLRRVGRAGRANGIDMLLSGIVLSVVLYFIALRTSPLILIPETACAFLVVRGLLDVGGSDRSTGDLGTVSPES